MFHNSPNFIIILPSVKYLKEHNFDSIKAQRQYVIDLLLTEIIDTAPNQMIANITSHTEKIPTMGKASESHSKAIPINSYRQHRSTNGNHQKRQHLMSFTSLQCTLITAIFWRSIPPFGNGTQQLPRQRYTFSVSSFVPPNQTTDGSSTPAFPSLNWTSKIPNQAHVKIFSEAFFAQYRLLPCAAF